MKDQIRKALDSAGYIDMEATEENLTDCFLDYVDSGYYNNLTVEEAQDDIESGEITIQDMIKNLG